MLLRRAVTTVVGAVAAVALAAGPASAHFCYKTEVNDKAAAGMAGSANWVTFTDYVSFTGLCPTGIGMLASAAGVSTDTLINGHGVMAYGAGGNKSIGHLDFGAMMSALPAAAAACGMPVPAVG
jgi:hypothetical protein